MEEFVPIPHFLMQYHDIQVPSHSLAHSQPPNAHHNSMNMGINSLSSTLNNPPNYEVSLNRWQPMHEHTQHMGQYIPSAETIPNLGEMKSQSSTMQGNYIPEQQVMQNNVPNPVPNVIQKPPTKKRNRRKMSQKTMKQCRQAGLGYVNRKGVEVKQKEFKYVDCKCRLHCASNLSIEARKDLFDTFWKLGSWDKQTNFIVKTTQALEPKRRTTGSDNSRRCFSRRYYLNEIRVCKQVYLTTLSISPMRIDYCLRKKNHFGIVYPDLRGKKGTNTKEAQKTMDQIHKLLETLPILRNSHYLEEMENGTNAENEEESQHKPELSLESEHHLPSHSTLNQENHINLNVPDSSNHHSSALPVNSQISNSGGIENNLLGFDEPIHTQPIPTETVRQGKKLKTVIKSPFKMSPSVMKHQRQTGGIYVNRKGHVIKPKQFTYVDCKCRLGCTMNLPRYIREGVFESFWKLGKWDLQTNFILQSIKVFTPRRRTKCQNPSRINWTRQYFLNDTRVCKVVYCSTLQVNPMRVDYVMKNISSRGEAKDLRGKATTNKTPQIVIDKIEQFLKSFPKYHPPNATSNRAYFHPELNKTKLYKLYKQSIVTEERAASFKKFKDVLKKYNVHIYVPKKDSSNPTNNQSIGISCSK